MTSPMRWPPTVLVVDDHPATVEPVARLLRLEDCHVVTADGVEEGLLEAARSRPDIIVLDLCRPLVDGLVFLRILRTRDRRNPTVAILASDHHVDAAVLDEVHDLGASIRFKPSWVVDLVDLAGAGFSPTDQSGRAPQVPS